MARSIHTTRRDLELDDPSLRERVEQDLDRKRRIKRWVHRERRAVPVPSPTADAIPLRVTDAHPYLHYPASPADLRAVLERLPAGTSTGLATIELCLGADAQHDTSAGTPEPDPHTGRPGLMRLSGVYSGRVLGTYSEADQSLRLFGYVYDPLRADRDVVETYLRLRMLTTFVHELAHHDDKRRRAARGRWTAEPGAKAEVYAEGMEYVWTREVVVPYLEQRHGDAVRRLEGWLLDHSGVSMSLAALAGDPRTTLREGGVAQFFTVADAFESLVEDVAEGVSSDTARVRFAEELHFGERYVEALGVLHTVLENDPKHLEARLLCADIHVHRKQLAEAKAIASAILRDDDSVADAWIVLTDVAQGEARWEEMAQHAERARDHLDGPEHWKQTWVTMRRARALVHLSRCREAIELLDKLLLERPLPNAAALRSVALLRSGAVREALDLANEWLKQGPRMPEFCAVRVHAALLLGIPEEAVALSEQQRSSLRELGYQDWLDELERHEPPASRRRDQSR